jgi:tRNA threonylcarbamoyladenosine biosynthesis protein TsaE
VPSKPLKTFVISHENELSSVIDFLKKNYPNSKIFLLKGDLGAGKTTFVKYFVQSIEPDYPVQSPTFNLVNIYQLKKLTVLHVDLYRLNSPEQVQEAGIPDILPTANYVFVEWYEHILPWISEAVMIHIQQEKDKRIIEIFP